MSWKYPTDAGTSAVRGTGFSQTREESFDLLYYGLLLYTVFFYSQIAARFPALAPLRLEFVLGSLLLIFSVFRILQGRIQLNENRLNFAMLLFILVMFVGIFFAYVNQRALNTFIKVFKFFSIYIIIIAAIDTEKKLKTFVLIYLATIALIFVQPFLLSLQGKGFIYNNHMMRLAGVTGMFKHPNGLGMITAANLPFFYFFMKSSSSRTIRILCLTLILISIRVIMLTQSRTAFVGVIAFVFLVWLFSKKRILGLFVGIAFFAALWQFAPDQTKDRFLTFTQTTRVLADDRSDLSHEELIRLGSMNSRIQLMRQALIAFTKAPILGLGLDCFASYSGRRWGMWYPPHNTYLQLLAETGIIGFLAFSFVVLLTLKNLQKAKMAMLNRGVTNRFLSPMLSGLTMSYAVFCIVSFFGIELYSNFWWLVGGLSVVAVRVIDVEYPEPNNTSH